MAISPEFLEKVRERLSVTGPIEIKKMFGGLGIYSDGIIFAVADDDILYVKTDATNRPDFEKAGMRPFVYDDNPHTKPSSYWTVPDSFWSDDKVLKKYFDSAMAAAVRSKKPVKKKA